MSKLPPELVRRIVLERELLDSRRVTYTLPSGERAEFVIKSLSHEEKNRVRDHYDRFFPTPPVTSNSLGIAQFDLENTNYQLALQSWNERLARGVLAASLEISEDEVEFIEQNFSRSFVGKLFATIELLNGIQSDPLVDLVRDAIFAPEVMTWMEAAPIKEDGIRLTDTPMFREMEAMIAAGLTLHEWENLSSRHKILYLTHHTYKAVREAYITDCAEKKAKIDAAKGAR